VNKSVAAGISNQKRNQNIDVNKKKLASETNKSMVKCTVLSHKAKDLLHFL